MVAMTERRDSRRNTVVVVVDDVVEVVDNVAEAVGDSLAAHM